MTIFLNLVYINEKDVALRNAIAVIGRGGVSEISYSHSPEDFGLIDGAPLLYYVPSVLLKLVREGQTLGRSGFSVRKGNGASIRFHRLHWEISDSSAHSGDWPFFVHGTRYSPFYKPSYYRMKWTNDGREAKADILHKYPYLNGNAGFVIQGEDFFGKPGLCYGKRTDRFSAQVLPSGHQFTFEGNAIEQTDPSLDPWVMLGLLNCSIVAFWLSSVCAQHKYPNYVESVPVPKRIADSLGILSRFGWHIKRSLDTVNQTSSAFVLPEVILKKLGQFDRIKLESELESIYSQIDEIAFELYGISKNEKESLNHNVDIAEDDDADAEFEVDPEELEQNTDTQMDLLSWAVGVAFGRFDWRLATGERQFPTEPDPFDSLPVKSPGMLPDDASPFHVSSGIMIDDPGNAHDLTRLIEEVLVRVEMPVPEDLGRLLQRDFFPYHLKCYSKSRRKAPIYWPISTTSSSFTLWIYYPTLTNQTLYTAINDFIEPKLMQVGTNVTVLRNKGSARSREDEKLFEAMQLFELELIELRDKLLELAPTYKPNLDDGVQINAAPLWPLLRHKPWQNILKDTWTKLEKGDYDWALLAMNYWPERVREKCKTDKSLAIAHGLEHLYEEPETHLKKIRGPKKSKRDE